ncbi:MAG: hypothetical protein IPL40_08810 [Proteobacteria bacterium]|nr:hypothetical protein [Pseudomonadota bacterium]
MARAASSVAASPVCYDDGGLRLRGTPLYFDAPRPRALCFVSHANVAGAAGHARLVASEATVRLLPALQPRPRRRAGVDGAAALTPALSVPYGQRFSLGRLDLELLPSSFALGAAALWVGGGRRSVLYTGPLRRPSPLLAQSQSQSLALRTCEVVVLPAGPDALRAPEAPAPEVSARALLAFIEAALAGQQLPLLLVPPLGLAQELVHRLAGAGYILRLHRKIFAACQAYAASAATPLTLGALRRGVLRRRRGGWEAREVALWPDDPAEVLALVGLPKVRRALIGGGAGLAAAAGRLGCEAAFALGGEPSYAELAQQLRASQATQVVLLGARDDDALERALRRDGWVVECCGPARQLTWL